MKRGIRATWILPYVQLLLAILVAPTMLRAGSDPVVALAIRQSSTNAQNGLCLYLGATGSRDLVQLAAGSRLFVLGMDSDRERASQLRTELQVRELPDRVTVAWRRTTHLPCLDNLVNLILAQGWGQGDLKGLPLEEIVRVLAPGGVAVVGSDKGLDSAALLAEAGRVPLTCVEKLMYPGAWVKIVKQMDPRYGEWSHYTGGPEQTMVASDKVAGAGKEVRWVNGPTWSSGNYRNDVVAGGRTFHEEKEWIKPGIGHLVLVARDAFNGCELWREKVGAPTAAEVGNPDRSLCADAKCVYLNDRTNLVARDAATGKFIRHYGPAQSSVTCAGDWLIGSTLMEKATGKSLVGLNSYPFSAHPVARDGVVYLLRGDRVLGTGAAVEAFQMSDGKSLWKVPYKEPEVRYKNASLLSGRGDNIYVTLGLTILALDRAHGATRWSYSPPTNVIGGGAAFLADKVCVTLVTKSGKDSQTERVYLDPATGKDLYRHPSPNPSARCWPGRNTDTYAIIGDGLFVDHVTGKATGAAGGSVRPACGVGQAMAYGLTYNGPHACSCMVSLRGVVAFSPGSAVPRGEEVAPRLITGTPTPVGAPAGTNDWPTYRGDMGRSDSYAGTLPPQLKKLWSVKLDKSPLPQVTGVGNRLFVADPEKQRVLALSVENGRDLWSFATEGRVSIAPTCHNGLCYFGDHAGWVYAVDAASGKLAWQFQAAPEQKLMGAYNRFESAWPVKSGVLVVQDRACFMAGRCGSMDGGVLFYSVDAANGTLCLSTNYNDTRPTDLLVSDGRTVFFQPSRESPGTGTYTPPLANTNQPPPATLPRLSAGQTYHGTLAILNVLDTLDPLQAGARKRGLNRGGNTMDGDLIAFDKDRTFITWSRIYWGQIPSREAVAGQEQVIRMDGNKWVNKSTGQQMQALLLSGTRLYCAGIPRNRDLQEAPTLWVLATEDGQEQQRVPLDGIPVIDGLSAVAGRLLLTTTDGQLVCFGTP